MLAERLGVTGLLAMSAPVNIRRFFFVRGNRWLLIEVAVKSFAAWMGMVGLSACAKDVREEDCEGLLVAGGDTSAVKGSA